MPTPAETRLERAHDAAARWLNENAEELLDVLEPTCATCANTKAAHILHLIHREVSIGVDALTAGQTPTTFAGDLLDAIAELVPGPSDPGGHRVTLDEERRTLAFVREALREAVNAVLVSDVQRWLRTRADDVDNDLSDAERHALQVAARDLGEAFAHPEF